MLMSLCGIVLKAITEHILSDYKLLSQKILCVKTTLLPMKLYSNYREHDTLELMVRKVRTWQEHLHVYV